MIDKERDDKILIIGAGASGLQAAICLAENEVACTVIDSASVPGGVVNRGSLRLNSEHDNYYLHEKLSRYEKYIDLKLRTEVVGPISNHRQFGLLTDQMHFSSIDYDSLFITTGCYERATPFPGWTLPGVMNLGGAQLQIKNNLVRPGKRVLVCGSGPLLPVAALQFKQAGMDVQGVFEANHFLSIAGKLTKLLVDPLLLSSGLSTMAKLFMSGVNVRYGWGIVEARGDGKLEEVVIAPYDKEWNYDRSRKVVVQVDCLTTAYGFVPRTELSRLLGLQHEVTAVGQVVPVVDEYCRASEKGMYIAGDAAAINGGKVASQLGVLMALTYLHDKHLISKSEHQLLTKKIIKKINRYKTFTSAFNNYATPRSGLLHLVDEQTIVCRCENVKRRALDEALDQGVIDLTTMKMSTRAGMGECQGKICGSFCADYMRLRLSKVDVGELKPRFPLVPVPFAAMPMSDES